MMYTKATLNAEIKMPPGEEGLIEGYGSVFNVVDSDNDVVMPGAFASHIGVGRPPAMLWQHDQREPIGVWTEAREDGRGLYMKGRLLTTVGKGREAYEYVKAGVVNGLSIGYNTEVAENDRATGVRKLIKLRLLEVSLVTFPSNQQAGISGVKAGPPQRLREFEAFLRDEGGFSHAAAKAIAARGFKAMEPRDEDKADTTAALKALLANIHKSQGNHNV